MSTPLGGCLLLACSAVATPVATALAEPTIPAAAALRAPVDRVAVRFYAAETGGPERPRFIFARVLAFEARLERMARTDGDVGLIVEPVHLRAALDAHVAEELLVSLPLPHAPARPQLEALAANTRALLEQWVGGHEALMKAAAVEGVSLEEVDELVWRHALAALYVDSVLEPVLRPGEDELLEVFRTGAHPFRTARYEQVRDAFQRWYVWQRLRAAESEYLQGARARVKIVLASP